ncbi:MAG: dipeptidase PepE [Ferruginibacter sp.]
MNTNSVLALSNSRTGNAGFLETAKPMILDFLGNEKKVIAFVPFASVTKDYEAYASMVSEALKDFSYTVKVVLPDNAKDTIANADVIMIGGGNTFKLLHDIYQFNLLDLIRDRVNAGIPYIGWSAGANITGVTIGTTNDMPIIQPKSFNALGFLPFQVNPHYYNQKIDGHNGETRDQRLTEHLIMNPGVAIVALPEGTLLKLEENKLTFNGNLNGIVFINENDNITRNEIKDGDNLSYLM